MSTPAGFTHPTADVADNAIIEAGSKVWHYAQVRENATIGVNSIVGRGAYVGTGVAGWRQLQNSELCPGL
jgi:UDP-2-acetamido-3-amino-2,3-dideoxy-glucuronate N-acetyltransferase